MGKWLKTRKILVISLASCLFMLTSWALGMYYRSIVWDTMVIYVDRYYWVSSFWGLLGATSVFSIITLIVLIILHRSSRGRAAPSLYTSLTTNGMMIAVWLVILFYQVKVFNLNEGICH